MARPPRLTVDYFPFYCDEGMKMFYIEETYGNDGFATFLKILRALAVTDNHYLDLSDNKTAMFLSAKCKVPKEKLLNIITDLSELGKFNLQLWNENKIVWCQDFIDSIQDAYKKRNNDCITFEGLGILLDSLGIRKQPKSTTQVDSNTQSKVEYSKVNKNKEYKTILLSELNSSDVPNSEYFEITIAFYELFKNNLISLNAPLNTIEKSKGIWIDEIRKLIEIDKYTKEDLIAVFNFLKIDEFWKPNILSTKKLREKFQTLLVKSRSNTSANIKNNSESEMEAFRNKVKNGLLNG